jgi:ubiquinone/menaquinone biosynthesis C-methylase UbiE
MQDVKKLAHDFWNQASCGESLYLDGSTRTAYEVQASKRYELEPMIREFAEFQLYEGKDVLEIGVGLGAEHQQFAQCGAKLHGIDLTERAVSHTKNRLKNFDLESDLQIGDAENLPYSNDSFDLVYSWGVLHHTPNTVKAISEVYRVLKTGGEAKIMIYHKYSMVGYMLWIRYALLKFRPFNSLTQIYDQYLESPGTKAYSINDAKKLFNQFKTVNIETLLTHGDLLSSDVGERHKGIFLTIARMFWPRWLIKNLFKSHGLFMMIRARK